MTLARPLQADPSASPHRPATMGELEALVGRRLGPGEWREITQDHIDAFAAATGDFNWLHVDRERAPAGPHGSTIAHGLFTLSLGPMLVMEILTLQGFPHVLNYGFDRVRFISPMPVDGRLRASVVVTSLESRPTGTAVRIEQCFESDAASKPVCVATSILYIEGITAPSVDAAPASDPA